MSPTIDAAVASSSRSSAPSGSASSARDSNSYASSHARLAYDSRPLRSSSTICFTARMVAGPRAAGDELRLPTWSYLRDALECTGGPMTKLTLDLTMSLDGFIAGPNQTVDHPLGEGGGPTKPARP